MNIGEVLARFEVRDPIKTLFQPNFTLHEADGWRDLELARVNLAVYAPDADGQRGVIRVTLDRTWERDMPEQYHLDQLRSMLMQMVTHEVDEAIQYSGVRVFDPHKGGR